jgi:alkylated DNA repair dioxygenase AlkB
MVFIQHSFFHELPRLPEGFWYKEELLPPEQEGALISTVEGLPFREFEFRGFKGKRRAVSFGWRYDFNVRELQPTQAIPTFLLPLRQRAAEFAGLTEDRLQQCWSLSMHRGAAIGGHRDRPEFDDVIGISLHAPCLFRFSRRQDTRWERASIELQPRSAYLLCGAVRWDWQHSIPAVDRLRYSVTFRSLRESKE